MANEIEDMVKTYQERVAKNLKAAQLENSLIFQIDDELIPGIDIPTNSTRSGTLFITLNGRGKRKYSEMESTNSSNNVKPSKDVVLLATSFRESIVILATALKDSRNLFISTPSALAPPALAPLAPLSADLDDSPTYEHCINKVKTELKNEMGEMKSMMEKILHAVAGQQAAAESSAAANQK